MCYTGLHSTGVLCSTVHLKNVTVFTTHLALVISHFNRNTSGRPITLSKPQSDDVYCPLSVLMQCLLMRGKAKALVGFF